MFSKYVLFEKRAPKQKGGCLDTPPGSATAVCWAAVCGSLSRMRDRSCVGARYCEHSPSKQPLQQAHNRHRLNTPLMGG